MAVLLPPAVEHPGNPPYLRATSLARHYTAPSMSRPSLAQGLAGVTAATPRLPAPPPCRPSRRTRWQSLMLWPYSPPMLALLRSWGIASQTGRGCCPSLQVGGWVLGAGLGVGRIGCCFGGVLVWEGGGGMVCCIVFSFFFSFTYRGREHLHDAGRRAADGDQEVRKGGTEVWVRELRGGVR